MHLTPASILVLTTLAFFASTFTQAAPASHKDNNKNNHSNRKNTSGILKHNPHALDASEERFSTCGNSKDVFKFQSVTSNRHICAGCKACVDIRGDLTSPIDHGSKVNLKISAYFFTVVDETLDLCDVLKLVPDGPQCPILPSSDGFRACFPVPAGVPTDISANLLVSAKDAKSNPLFCLQGTAMVESHCPKDVGIGSDACNK